MLDELLGYSDCVLIIVLNNHYASKKGSKRTAKVFFRQAEGKRENIKRREINEQTHCARPEDGQNAQQRNQARAFFHEVSKPRKA